MGAHHVTNYTGEVTPTPHNKDPEFYLLSEQKPVQKKSTTNVSICAFGGPLDPVGPSVVQCLWDPYLCHRFLHFSSYFHII